MSVLTITSKNYPKELNVKRDFPKCVCGGKFIVHDNFSKKGVFYGTTADCIDCGEHFVMDSYNDLNSRIPQAQEIRKNNKADV